MTKTMFGAIALAFAVPAFAQEAPAEPKKMECCEKMKAEGKQCCCCKEMAGKGHGDHGKHDPKMDHQDHGKH